MAETTADVRRDIEMTRERMSTTLAQLEQKVNLMQIVRDHPWPAVAVAVGAGVLLSGSRADVKAAGATVAATRGASSKIGTVLDDLVANLVTGVSQAFQQRVDSFVNEIKGAIGAPAQGGQRSAGGFGDGADRARAATWSGGTADSRSQGLGGDTRSSGSPSAAPLGSEFGGTQNSGGREWQGPRAD
jgi:hypothetical protein